jgi:4-oxalocrotonate tautomerase
MRKDGRPAERQIKVAIKEEMPIVKIDMIEGRTDEQKKNMVREVTEAIAKTADAKPETITIIINDLPKINIAKAGKSMAETVKYSAF